MPSISVIVPIYKVAPYLKECLESIQNQIFEDFQAFLTDDGSPDDDADMADSTTWSDTRFICIHQQNGGLSAARNHGLDLQQSPFLTCVDSDDYVEPDYLVKMLEHMTDELDIVQCSNGLFRTDTGLFWKNVPPNRRITPFSGREACLMLFRRLGAGMVIAWGKIYRSQLFETLRYSEKQLYEDSRIAHLVFWKTRSMLWIPDILYQYRVRGDSIMQAPASYRHIQGKSVAQARLEFFSNIGDEELLLLSLKARVSELIRTIHDSPTDASLRQELNSLVRLRPNEIDNLSFTSYYSYSHPFKFFMHRIMNKILRLMRLL